MKFISKYLLFVITILMLQSCGQFVFDQDHASQIAIAKKTLIAIEGGQRDSIRAHFSRELNDRLTSSDLNDVVKQTKLAMIDGLPPDSLIQISSNLSFPPNGKSTVTKLSFPIEVKNTNIVDSAIYINISIVEDKVNSIATS